MSDIESCSANDVYTGPDGSLILRFGTCTDKAGNTGTNGIQFKFDDTNPTVSVKFSRPTDHNGWFNAPVDYMVDTNTDATSGIDTCQGSDTYSTPDSSSASVSRSCTDVAGNTGSGSQTFKFDDTNPTLDVALARSSDNGGWYNHALGYSASNQADNLSGIESCDPPATYSTPDADPAIVSRTCTDKAGKIGSASKSFRFDATAPTLEIALARGFDHNDWY